MPSTTRFLPGPLSRLRGLLRELQGLGRETRDLASAVHRDGQTHSQQLAARLDAHDQTLSDLGSRLERLASDGEQRHEQLVEILRFINDRGQWRRLQLRRLRAAPGYEKAFTDPEPLISVVIPTYDNYPLLRDRSIPSVLAQSYQSFEIVVVGDAAPDEARRVVEAFGDQRIAFFNLPYRGPYPNDAELRWLVSGVPAYNEAVARARGLWIAPLDDDDAFRPNHLERLLEYARRDRLELAYSRLAVHFPNGAETTIDRFPPEYQEFGVQSALYHAGLAGIFEYELADAPLGLPSDWALCLRMMEAGVRMGMLNEVSVDYYPSRSWTPRWENDRYGPVAKAEQELPEWEYIPEGWERAGDSDDLSAHGWSVEHVAHAYREKWPQFLAAVEGPGPMGVNHETPAGVPIGRHGILDQNAILAFAYAVERAANGPPRAPNNGMAPLSVLDWGGALGHYRVLAERLLPEIKLDYHCRELPAVCAVGRALHSEVTFHEGDDCFDRNYDLVVASNSLQSVENWQSLLKQLVDAADGWLFLTRVQTTSAHPSFVVLHRVQRYGYQTEYLSWALNRDDLLQTATAVGLELEREFLVHPPWKVVAAPAEVTHTGFLFRVPKGA